MLDDLRWIADIGGLGVLALFIIVGGVLARAGMNLFRDNIIPLVQNHLAHLEGAYSHLADALEKHAEAIENMEIVQAAQASSQEMHNDLTRELIERLPKRRKPKS